MSREEELRARIAILEASLETLRRERDGLRAHLERVLAARATPIADLDLNGDLLPDDQWKGLS